MKKKENKERLKLMLKLETIVTVERAALLEKKVEALVLMPKNIKDRLKK